MTPQEYRRRQDTAMANMATICGRLHGALEGVLWGETYTNRDRIRELLAECDRLWERRYEEAADDAPAR